MIHLVFGAAAIGSLKHALRNQSDKVIGFPIDYSVGPITNIHNKTGTINYFSWLKSSYNLFWNYFDDDESVYEQALHQLLSLENGEQITIWTCENASEQIGLRITCYLLKNKQVELNVINTFKALEEYMEHQDIRINIRTTGECNAEQLAYFYGTSICPIPEETRTTLEKEGGKLIQSKSIVRSWIQQKIFYELETRDDSFIMACAKRIHKDMRASEYINVLRVIGEVLGHSEEYLTDAWIEYRIRSLIQSGHLMYKGNLQSIREYKIKVV